MNSECVLDLAELLAPISEERRSGVDLRNPPSADYVKLKALRQMQEQREDGLDESGRPDWVAVAASAREILSHVSKDIEVACWWTQAVARIHGVAGLLEGLHLIAAMERQFGDDLYPETDARIGRLGWLAHPSMVSVVVNAPLTEAVNHTPCSWNMWRRSSEMARADKKRREELVKQGWITSEVFARTFEGTSPEFYARVGGQLDECLEGVVGLEVWVREQYQESDFSLEALRAALRGCLELVNQRRPREESQPRIGQAEGPLAVSPLCTEPKLEAVAGPSVEVPEVPRDGAVSGSGDTVREPILVQASGIAREFLSVGKFGRGLEVLQDWLELAASGRERFLRMLEIAEYCIEGGHESLAQPLFTELEAVVEKRELHLWERPDVCARVWAGVVGCVETEKNGKGANEAQMKKLFERICRTDITRAHRIASGLRKNEGG